MKKNLHLGFRLALLCLSICGFMQVYSQQTLPTDASLKALEAKYLSTPVKQLVQPDGSLWLQRDFASFLHAMPRGTGIAQQATDKGHDHSNNLLETFLNRPHPGTAALQQYFAEAATRYGVPVALLQAYAQQQSNWTQVSESAYGSWGIMGLTENQFTQQLSVAAALLQMPAETFKNEAKANIYAAAALLARYQQPYGKAETLADWYDAIAQLTGYADDAMRYSFADRVYKTLQQGIKTISLWGEIIYLPPMEKLKMPDAPTLSTIGQFGNGTPDYPAAQYNLTTCNYNSRPGGAAINFYFVHYIATGTYEGTISWFKNCSSQVSAHYVVRNSDGQVTQMVDEANRAWSQGVTEYNDQGIGVEHEVLAANLSMWDSEPMLNAAGSLASDVCNRNTIPKQRRSNNGERGIYGHSDVRATDCPNMTPERWTAFLAKVQGAIPAVGAPTLYTVSGTAASGSITATWKANTEPTLLGYRLYYATNDNLSTWALAADETMLPAGTTSITLSPANFKVPPATQVFHFKLHAVVPFEANPPVESAASDVYSRAWYATGPKVLIVDGFDRTSGSYGQATHAFVPAYLKGLRDRSLLQISSAANEKVEDGTINMADYAIVVWFVGDESSANVVFSASEKQKISAYLQGGGKMLISGSEIAYNVGRAAAAAYDLSFTNNFLKANYVGDGAGNYSPATGIAATAFEGLNIPFGIVYPEDFPDDIAPVGGAQTILAYAVAGKNGGIAYTGMFSGGAAPGALVYLGFPLETAADISINLFMQKLLAYFGIAPIPAPPIAVADMVTTAAQMKKRIRVLDNDQGNGNTINAASIEITIAPANGTASTDAEGNLYYTPNNGFTGNDALQYRISSTQGVPSAPAAVTITVNSESACAATPPEVDDSHPLRDLRGAWVSSVSNIDWPSSRTLSTAQQQAELLRILDTLKNTGINTVYLQVRPECDALYASTIDPWSYWLTNAQGTAPSPAWDPLAFAAAEAHKRGMDMHAWLNPFRAKQSTPALAPNHVVNLHPDWTFISGSLTMLNPGLPQVRQYLQQVVADIASRYDLDGIHFDDYFYPYGGMTGQDNETFTTQNPTNIATIEDWRRNNINTMIAMVYDTLQHINTQMGKNIVFGVSPFGIWKSGTPAGISGTSSYSQIYCDPIAWLQQGKVDYLAPQLYWKITGAQDYQKLSQWWNDQGKLYGRQIYPGLALYKMSDANNWAASEITNQIALNRDGAHDNTFGQVMFSTKQIMTNVKGVKDALQQGPYRYLSYAPAMAHKDALCPNAPTGLLFDGDSLRWQMPTPAADGDTAERFVVFRYANAAEAMQLKNDGTKVMAITGTRSVYAGAGAYVYAVLALDKNNNASPAAISSTPPIALCEGGSAQLQAATTGSSYQWQILNGGNWTNLTNNANFSGTATATLAISNLPGSYYGSQFRCLVNGAPDGSSFTLIFRNTWTGTQDNNWFNNANWSCGQIPTSAVDVVIPAGRPNYPVVNANGAVARSILVATAASITLAENIIIVLGN